MRKFNRRVAATSLCVALVLNLFSNIAHAQQENGRFKLYISGIPAGQLIISANNDGKSYNVIGNVRSTGLIGSIVKVGYDAQSYGFVRNGKLSPQAYSEKANTGRRQQSSQLSYKGGVPQVLKVDPPRSKRDWDVDPKGQKGTLDPLSMIYTSLRDIDEADVCKLNQKMFDGRRLGEIVLSSPVRKEDRIICNGVYRRLGGFSSKDMQERSEFRFKFEYKAAGGGRYQVDQISSESLFGKMVIKRK